MRNISQQVYYHTSELRKVIMLVLVASEKQKYINPNWIGHKCQNVSCTCIKYNFLKCGFLFNDRWSYILIMFSWNFVFDFPLSDLVLFFCFFLCIRYSLNPFFTITSCCLHYIQNTSRANNNLFETRVYNIMSCDHIHLISDSIEINSIMLGYFYHESSVIWQKVS